MFFPCSFLRFLFCLLFSAVLLWYIVVLSIAAEQITAKFSGLKQQKNIYYYTISVGQEFTNSLAGWFLSSSSH